MSRFVKHFFEWQGDELIEDQINNYAERNGLTIITIAPLYQNGMYVLFEEEGANNDL
jgi:hypothetical protein